MLLELFIMIWLCIVNLYPGTESTSYYEGYLLGYHLRLCVLTDTLMQSKTYRLVLASLFDWEILLMVRVVARPEKKT